MQGCKMEISAPQSILPVHLSFPRLLESLPVILVIPCSHIACYKVLVISPRSRSLPYPPHALLLVSPNTKQKQKHHYSCTSGIPLYLPLPPTYRGRMSLFQRRMVAFKVVGYTHHSTLIAIPLASRANPRWCP